MGLRGPVAKSAELRVLEGNLAHRPLPPAGGAVPHVTRLPERPKGLTGKARRAWDAYLVQLAPLGVLRPVDGFALSRLCEDVAELQELTAGRRKLAAEIGKKAKQEGKALPGGALLRWTMSAEDRGVRSRINALKMHISRAELQFGLTPVSSQRLENLAVMPAMSAAGGAMDPVEAALCG